MATPQKKSHSGKVTLILILLFAAGLGGFGYFSQTSELRNTSEAAEPDEHDHAAAKADPSDPVFIAKTDDIVIGSNTAPVTIVEYSSLSCPHCAHFHTAVLPQVKAKLLDTGRAKLVFRHFALNEPALRAAQLVECSPADKREAFTRTLFENQDKWAFSESFKDDLKRFAAAGGIDAAQFDSCLADKEGENAILATRQEAGTKVGVNATPSFYVNGTPLTDWQNVDTFVKATDEAAKAPAAKAE